MGSFLAIALVALLFLILWRGGEIAWVYRKARADHEERFEPKEIGDLSPEKGDLLVCTESYGEFTEGYNYIVRVEYGGALVVWNDEGDNVLAAGLDPRKFRVVEKNVDGTASMAVTCECRDGIDINCDECNEKIRRDS